MRALLYAALMLLFSLPAYAVDGFNLPGSDYDNSTPTQTSSVWTRARATSGARPGRGSNQGSRGPVVTAG
jgi:hypothetical protein